MKAVVLLTLALAAAACTESTPPPKSPAAATILQAPAPTACPLGVQGARVAFDETPGGGTLTFLAGPASIDELRERARDAAAQHGPGQRAGKGHDGKHQTGAEHGLKMMQMPPSRTVAEDIEGGARIRFTAADPQEVDVLRNKLRARVQEMIASCD